MPLPQSPSSPGEEEPIQGGGTGTGRSRTRSWFARFTGGAAAGGGAPMDEEAARRYRQRVFQMGLLVCLFLLFVDQRGAATTGNGAFGDASSGNGANASYSPSASSASAHGGGLDDDWVVQGIPEPQTARLNQFLELQAWDGGFYPKNVTGVFRGAWSKNASEPRAAGAAKEKGDEGSPGAVTLRSGEGHFDMPLFMASIPGVEGLSAVYGYLRLFDGEASTDRDVYAVTKGVYLHKSGRLLLRSMSQEDSERVAFTFALPASYAAASNASNAATAADAATSGEGGGGKADAAVDDGTAASGGSGVPGGRQLSWQQRRAATPQEQALGRRLAALWREDGVRDEETRLLQVFEAVVDAGAGKAGEETSEAIGMTLLEGGEAAAEQGGEEKVGPDGRVVASVLIPNRAQGQYIRPPSANGKGCTFTLDAHALPRLNSTQLAEARATAAAAAVAAPAGNSGRDDDDDDVVGGRGGGGGGGGIINDDDVVVDDDAVDAQGAGGMEALSAVDERLVWAEGLEGTLSSPECGVALAMASHEAVRLDWGQAYRKAVNYSVVVTLVCVLQIALLFRQLYYSRTQAAASRVSLLGVGQQAILDALLCIAHLLLCATLQPLFAAFASIAFFKLVIFSIFEIRYMFIIHQSRNSQSANAAGFNGLRRQLASLHARFYAILFVLLFLIYFLANYLEVIIFLLYSFWVPQIVLNASKGIRHPLNRTYVVGMSAARLVIPLYIYGCPYNFIHLLFADYRPDYRMCAALVTWMAVQVGVLLSQDWWGPQYMIPARFLPPKYDYYRRIPSQVLRRTGGRGGGEGREGEGEGEDIEMTDIEGGELPECVICYNGIDVAQPGGYMVSPCDHLFHRECLERWMDIKLECPYCRAALPNR